ncbi:phage head closure protein [Testudinibacter sp. TR-2022]|uniref:phage head closure protein n=1 Tax=Testudinibacter sp. TR-2022 TaxID=2585029 RepID=UPI0011195272|nr:phage head closure protein [Testudinibacter sp. TR-2022]TNH06633.1 head-tail adaptor protein [Pasteurellaceae bacterium Phil11]TNH25530.1 head-tail adaptor protein [Testudinibacter sp. TR-2022]TNH25692.1 head-tail adaptor protein [Testudinibacter sp. TR-2022]
MQIGKLRHRITLQQQITQLNSYGGTITDWQDVATAWAEVKPLSGREYFAAEQVQSEITTQIWLRYRPDIQPTMRVKWGDRTFEVISVINHNERNTALQLMCKERINGQRHG